MPKRGSDLIKFLREALYGNKYRNLFWIDQNEQYFCLKCIHGGNKDWTSIDCQIFKDWGNQKKRRHTEKNVFSEGRQRFLAAMNKCKLLKKFKKRSTVSIKFYQFISDGVVTDAENTSDEVSDRESSPEPACSKTTDPTDCSIQIQMIDGSLKVMPLNDLNFEFPNRSVENLVGNISIIKIPISVQNAVDPNFLTDSTEIATHSLQEDDLELNTSLLDISDATLDDLTLDLVADSSSMIIEEQSINICDVGNGITENLATTPSAIDGNLNLTFADTTSDFPLEVGDSEPVLPPVQLFKFGEYIIGVTKVPVL